MADGQLHLDARVVLDGARNLSAAGVHLLAAYWRAGMSIVTASGARPWGSDDIGTAVDRNYRPIEQQVMQAWFGLGEHLQALGDAAAASVGDNQGADQEAAVRVTRAHREHP
jgi:hypothetical protein